MDSVFAVVVMLFVIAVLGLVVYALFEMSPFAHHSERFHEPGQRQQTPRLD